MSRFTLTSCRLLSLAPLFVATAGTIAQEAEPLHQPATGSAPVDSESAPQLRAIPADAWRIEFNSWIWAMGLNGEIGVLDRSADVDASFGDIIDGSDSIFALSGRLEVGYGKVAGFIDGLYSDLGVDDASGPPGFADVDVSFEQAIVDFGTMFRVIDKEPEGDAAKNHHNFTLDLYAGGRYVSLELELEPENEPERSLEDDWFDPIFGAKVVIPFAENWHIAINGDVGGFGIGSDFTWSATGVIGYDFHLFGMPSSVMAGYRAIGWEYTSSNQGDFEWDIIQHGFILGFGMKF